MKRLSILTAFFCLFLTGAISAQDKTAANFAGTWELDTTKSKLPERMRVESGTLTVTQTDKQLTVATDFKRAARSENLPPTDGNGGMRPEGNRGMRGEGGGGGRRMMGGGNGTATYNLDGKETTGESETPAGMPPSSVKLKAETEKDGKLKLLSTRSFETQMGAMTVKTVDVWELLDGGKTLKISRETETPRGSQSAELYFTKKETNEGATAAANNVSTKETNANYAGASKSMSASDSVLVAEETTKTINGGVLNGSALVLTQPKYPKEAKKGKIGGTVGIRVKIDEQGNVVSAEQVSGDPVFKEVCIEAAKNSKFTPTMLEGKAVKVTGIIDYNFIL